MNDTRTPEERLLARRRLGSFYLDDVRSLIARAEAAERERDNIRSNHDALYRSAVGNRDGRKRAEAQRDELVEALERILGDHHSYEHAHKLARAALAKVRGEAE